MKKYCNIRIISNQLDRFSDATSMATVRIRTHRSHVFVGSILSKNAFLHICTSCLLGYIPICIVFVYIYTI